MAVVSIPPLLPASVRLAALSPDVSPADGVSVT